MDKPFLLLDLNPGHSDQSWLWSSASATTNAFLVKIVHIISKVMFVWRTFSVIRHNNLIITSNYRALQLTAIAKTLKLNNGNLNNCKQTFWLAIEAVPTFHRHNYEKLVWKKWKSMQSFGSKSMLEFWYCGISMTTKIQVFWTCRASSI